MNEITKYFYQLITTLVTLSCIWSYFGEPFNKDGWHKTNMFGCWTNCKQYMTGLYSRGQWEEDIFPR